MGPSSGPRPWTDLGRFLELQNVGLNLPFALAFLWIAAGGLPSLRIVLLVLVAFIAARNAGHSFNRFADRRFDLATVRTRARPAVADRPAIAFALGFAAANAVILLVAAFLLNPLAFVLAPVALAFVFGYSYTKRFTSLTTVFLGLVEAITPAAVFVAVRGALPLEAFVAVAAMLAWGTAFEILHSLGDLETDRRQGLFSIPVRWGALRARRMVPLLHAGALAALTLFGRLAGMTTPYFVGLIAVAAVIAWTDLEVFLHPEEVRRPFRRHVLLGVLFFVGVTWAVFFPSFI
ncbi:MAG: 4-hydroxybenzoate octaprenyltransferase [Thermoplasmata archaeon]